MEGRNAACEFSQKGAGLGCQKTLFGLDIGQQGSRLNEKSIDITFLGLLDRALMCQTGKECRTENAQKPCQIILDWGKGPDPMVNAPNEGILMRHLQNREKDKNNPNDDLNKKRSNTAVNLS
jgi:hypothetical protein